MSDPAARELVLHVGMGKTGTSTVQFFLRDYRNELARRDLLLPRVAGGARHGKVGLYAKDDAVLTSSPEWPRLRADDPARFRRRFRRRLLAEVAESGTDRVLLTDEVLFMQPADALARLRSLTDALAAHTRVVAYLRRQDDHMVSRYQQGVKIGWIQRLSEWVREDMSDLYDYDTRLRLHKRVLAPETLVVRRYEPARFVAGSLVRDFLDACAVDLEVTPQTSVPDRNLSLDAETVEFLRLLNLHLVEADGATPGQIDHRALVPRLAPAATGPTLSLPRAQLDRWREQWADSDRAVARRHFDDDGPLFDPSPPSRPVTTEQVITPARADELAVLAELPDEVREAVRRLAVREAGRRERDV